jgi:hypothetical protein
MARADERGQQVAADEAVRSGQEDIHGAAIIAVMRAPRQHRRREPALPPDDGRERDVLQDDGARLYVRELALQRGPLQTHESDVRRVREYPR